MMEREGSNEENFEEKMERKIKKIEEEFWKSQEKMEILERRCPPPPSLTEMDGNQESFEDETKRKIRKLEDKFWEEQEKNEKKFLEFE